MKTIIKFNLNNIEDKQQFIRVTKADDMALSLWQIKNLITNEMVKKLELLEENDSINQNTIDELFNQNEYIISRFNEILENNNIHTLEQIIQ